MEDMVALATTANARVSGASFDERLLIVDLMDGRPVTWRPSTGVEGRVILS